MVKRLSFIFGIMFLMFFLCALIYPSPFLVNVAFAGIKKDQKVTFNFVDVDLSTVTKFISEITGKNFIFDERVKGKITIIAPTKLSADDAYNLFTSVLELKGFTVITSGIDAYKIVPAMEAKQRGMQIATERLPVNESYIARLIPLRYISSDDALRFLQPVVSKDGHISAFGPGNLLLVIDSGLNVEKILTIIEAIDQPSIKEKPEIVILKYSSADAIAKILNEGMSRGKIRAPGQPVLSDEARVVADQRLNAVVLFGDKGMRESMKSLIALLDIPSPEAQGRINVYFLENADATELSKVLEGMLKAVQPTKQAAPGAPVMPFEAAGGITITPDKATNSLVVVASPADYQNLLQVIKHLDKKRRQVFVEAMIIEASIDKLRELGTKWRVTARHKGEPVVIGGFGTMDPNAFQSVIYGLSGLTAGGMGNFLDIPVTTIDPSTGRASTTTLTVPGFATLFSLNEFRGTVNVLSTPQILTSDNKEAEIMVGENVPFVSKRERDITTTNTVLSSIERYDVGIKLKITPQITEGDHVKLDIYQEISNLVQGESESILINVGPTITKRSTKTSVVVKDRETVVIGGLMAERQEENITKVPVLGDIPILGWLFKTTSVKKQKTNLLVFLTPHVVKEADSLAQITKDKEKEFAKVEKQYVEGELLIKFKEEVPAEKAFSIISEKGALVIKFIENIKVYHIKLRKGQGIEDAVEEFSSIPEIQYAEPNYKMKMQNVK
ncbi:MAG: type II secretion system protein GspD [Nitrospira sp.]|nr:type II secretion system protein GspD [Nitrospira sp.]